MTKIFSLILSLFHFKLPVNWPQTFSKFMLFPTMFSLAPALGLLIVLIWLQKWLCPLHLYQYQSWILQVLYSNTPLLAILLCDYLLNIFCTLKCIFRFFWYITCYWVDCFLGLAVILKICLFCIYNIQRIIQSIILQDSFSSMGRNISTPSTMFCLLSIIMSFILWWFSLMD